MSTFTFSAGAGDCWGSSATGVVDTDTNAYLGRENGSSKVRDWIPFTVNLPKSLVITSATLKVIATVNRSDFVSVFMGCEDADNPTMPTDWSDILGRSLTSGFTAVEVDAYTNGDEHTYDITTAVQEILNRAGWAPGNTMAVLIIDDATPSGAWRRFATLEHATFAEPKLEIVFPSFIPRMGMV